MICPSCKSEVPNEAVVCPNCGVMLPRGFPQQAAPPPAAPQYDGQVTLGQWIGIFLINIVPCVGPLVFLVLLFVWAFGNPRSPSLKSFAAASLILIAAGVVICVIVALLGGFSDLSSLPDMIQDMSSLRRALSLSSL